jgi:uncharacterized protein (TIGR03000 family)
MWNRWVTITGAALVAAAGLLLTPGTAPAQHHGGGHASGMSRGGDWGRGGYYGGWGREGWDRGRGFYGWGGYPGYYGGYYPGYYYSPSYDYGTYSVAPDYYSTPAPDYGATAPRYGTAPAASSNTALLTINVPDPNADIWFNGAQTVQKGTERQFEPPALDPGRDYTYDVRARWMENGQQVDQKRQIAVHAGDRLTVNFSMPRAAEDRTPATVPPISRSEQVPADRDRAPVDRTSRPDRTAPDTTRPRAPPADRTAPSDQVTPDRPPDRTPPADRLPDR